MKFRILRQASLKASPDLLEIQADVLKIKERLDKLKGPNPEEVEKALDDATSALDSVVHHLLDIYGE
jgi:predicted  nucleic acid-binding Zn-ribbon protein